MSVTQRHAQKCPLKFASLVGLVSLSLLFIWSLAFSENSQTSSLVKALKENSVSKRREAAEKLGQLRDTEAREALINALSDQDSGVRKRAAKALGRLGDQGAIQPLLLRLDKDIEIRQDLILALGHLRAKEAIPRLIELLGGGEKTIRWASANALGDIGDPQVVPTLVRQLSHESDEEVRIGIIEALGKLGGEEALTALTSLLEKENRRLRKAAVQALGNISQATAQPFREALEKSDKEFKEVIVKVVGEWGRKEAIPLLLPLLQDPSCEIKGKSAEALGKSGKKEALDGLSGALKDECAQVRAVSVEAIGEIVNREVESAKHLKERTSAATRRARRGAIESLAELIVTSSDSLVSTLSDRDLKVRQAVLDTIGRIGETFTALVAKAKEEGDPYNWAEQGSRVLTDLYQKSGKLMIEALTHSDPDIRWRSARTLSRLRDQTAAEEDRAVVEALIRALSDKEGVVRWNVAHALGNLQVAEAAPVLTKLLTDKDDNSRWEAIEALGTLKEKNAVRLLMDLVKAGKRNDRLLAIEALGKIGDDAALPLLLEMMNIEDREVRQETSKALSGFNNPQMFPLLVKGLNDRDPYVRRNSAEVLVQMKLKEAAKPLIASLKDEDYLIRRLAAEFFREFPDPEALESLTKTLEDEDLKVKTASIDALGKIGDRQAVQPLILALQDHKPQVREKAAQALGLLRDQRAVEPLIEAIKQERLSPDEMINALGQIDLDRSIQLLKDASDQSEGEVKERVGKALEVLQKKKT
ncbi:MAG: HEAT repeat domain-containing protein [Candidatus Tectomicrobia bacterium]|nr:HEAT repeat domain-containing protein [Candidatus Tectomicrobia bacterium]